MMKAWPKELNWEMQIWWFFWGIILVWVVIWQVISYRLPYEIPFLFSLPWGEEQLVERGWGIKIILASISVHLLNSFIFWRIKDWDMFLARVVFWGGILFLSLLIITTLKIALIFL